MNRFTLKMTFVSENYRFNSLRKLTKIVTLEWVLCKIRIWNRCRFPIFPSRIGILNLALLNQTYRMYSKMLISPCFSFNMINKTQCNCSTWVAGPDHDLTLLFKGFVARCHSFCLFLIFYYIHTSIQSHSYNTFIRRPSLRSLSISSSLIISVGKPPCCAEPRIELWPELQQADALPTEPTLLFMT